MKTLLQTRMDTGFSQRNMRLPELLNGLAIARGEGNCRWLLHPLKETEAGNLLEIVEERCKKVSTIFCFRFEVGGWHPKIGESTLADAICDRIIHYSYTIVIGGGDSMRKHNGITEV